MSAVAIDHTVPRFANLILTKRYVEQHQLHGQYTHGGDGTGKYRLFPIAPTTRSEPTRDPAADAAALDAAVANDQRTARDVKYAGRFMLQDSEDFTTGEDVPSIVHGLLPRAELAVVYGQSGSGKTFLVAALCLALARGEDFGDFKIHGKHRVAYICAEGRGGFKLRLKAYAKHFGVSLKGLLKVIADCPNFLDDDEATVVGDRLVPAGPLDVCVVDTLSAVSPAGNENSSEDMGAVLKQCKELHRRTGALIILIHHSGKDATKGARGWSGLRAAADAEIEVTRVGETEVRDFKIVKMKEGEDGARFGFRLNSVDLGKWPTGERKSSCYVTHCPASEGIKATSEPTGPNLKAVIAALKEMTPTGAVSRKAVLDFLMSRASCEPEEVKAVRKGYSKAITDGVREGRHLFKHDDKISLTRIVQGTDADWLNTKETACRT